MRVKTKTIDDSIEISCKIIIVTLICCITVLCLALATPDVDRVEKIKKQKFENSVTIKQHIEP